MQDQRLLWLELLCQCAIRWHRDVVRLAFCEKKMTESQWHSVASLPKSGMFTCKPGYMVAGMLNNYKPLHWEHPKKQFGSSRWLPNSRWTLESVQSSCSILLFSGWRYVLPWRVATDERVCVACVLFVVIGFSTPSRSYQGFADCWFLCGFQQQRGPYLTQFLTLPSLWVSKLHVKDGVVCCFFLFNDRSLSGCLFLNLFNLM